MFWMRCCACCTAPVVITLTLQESATTTAGCCYCCIYLCKWAAKSWQSRRSLLTRDTMRRARLFSHCAPPPPLLDGSTSAATAAEVIISAASRSFVLGEFLGFYGRAHTHTRSHQRSHRRETETSFGSCFIATRWVYLKIIARSSHRRSNSISPKQHDAVRDAENILTQVKQRTFSIWWVEFMLKKRWFNRF